MNNVINEIKNTLEATKSRITGIEKWTCNKSWPMDPSVGVWCGWGGVYEQCLEQGSRKSQAG